ncbi:MAG TPA: prepilin peptidase [Pirellulales bacterium]|nr:prepilin peptidase [Pirellulales bacterium]
MPLFAQHLAANLPTPVWWLAVVWMFTLGASIGSFLNVVVYRLPAGLSLVRPGSHCPKCKTPLAARDNIPIFGWLWLRGRCRYCGVRISPRYPAVELLTACVFALVACVEPLSGAANLPATSAIADSDLSTFAMLWVLFAYHVFLLSGLICAVLMEYDGQPIGPRLSLPMCFVGAAAPLFGPELRPVASGLLSSDALAEFPWAAGLVDGLLGVAAGALAGLAIRLGASREPVQSGARPFRSAVNAGAAMAWSGLFLGWQAIGALALATAAAKLALSVIGRIWPSTARVGWIGCLAPLVLAWIVGWQAIAAKLAFDGAAGEFGAFAAALAVTAGLSWAIGKWVR